MFGLGWFAVVVTSAMLVVGCGVSDGSGQETGVEVPAASAGGVESVIPSTTTPVRLAPADCVGGAVEVVERVLIERRQGFTAVGCGTGSGSAELDGCWSECDDGRRFVDFDLDTTRPGDSRPVDGGGEVVAVDYAARYATDADGTTTAAETLVLTRSDPTGGWVVTDLEVTDTSAERTGAATAMEHYFTALRAGDYVTAAELMHPTGPVDDRDDLGRLVDEGFLSGTSPAEIADALWQWCASGAACTATPDVEIEVTATHALRAIATYQLASGAFETTFRFDGPMIIGLPIRVG